MRILVFGDSIAYGAWDEEGGWADRLKRFLLKKTLSEDDFRCHLMNLSISGDQTSGLVSRYEFEAKQREREEEVITIFAIGINDSKFLSEEEKVVTPPNDFEDNLSNLVGKAKEFSSKIIFIGITPVDESEVNPWRGDTYRNKYIKGFDGLIEKVSNEENVRFVKIFEKFKEEGYENLLEDGLHPNTKGHEKLYEIIKDYLVSEGLI